MSNVLWTLGSIIAYIAGLVIMLKGTPPILERAYDEGLFMLNAIAVIFGAMLAFGGVVVTYAVFNAHIVVRVFDFLMLAGILFVTVRLGLFSLRPGDPARTNRVTRIVIACFCFGLSLAAVYYIVQLFLPA